MKVFYKKITSLLLITSFAFLSNEVASQTIINENFNYGKKAGKLTGVSGGNWVRHSGSTSVGYSPNSLTMSHYPSSGIGGSLTFENGSGSREDVERKFTEQKTEFIYVSTLIKVSSSTVNQEYTFALRGEKRYRVRGFFKDDGKGKLKFGIRKNSRGTITYSKGEYQYNTVYLLVFKYDFTKGEASLYVLSTVSTTEPATPDAKTTSGGDVPSINAIGIRQHGKASKGTIDGIRVGTTWKSVMTKYEPTATLTVTGKINDFGKVKKGTSSTAQKFTLSGKSITDDVVVKAPKNFEVSLTPTLAFAASINLKAKGNLVATTDVYVRFSPKSGSNQKIAGKITISTKGALSKHINVTGTETGNTPVAISTIRPVNDIGRPTKERQRVFIKGNMLGYDKREKSTGFQIVINDGTGGVVLRDTKGVVTKENFKEGDEIEVTGTVGFHKGTTQLINISSIAKKSTGNKRPAPKKVTKLDETTEQELIKLENVTIDDKTQWKGKTGNTKGFNVKITYGGNKKGTLRIENYGSDLHTKTYQEVFGDKTTGINLVGIGGQYDSSDPFNTGYQILVYKKEDISFFSGTATLTVTGKINDFGNVKKGDKSSSQKFSVAGNNTTADISIKATDNFEVSLDNKVFAKEVKITKKGTVPATDLHVRFAPNSGGNGVIKGKITISTAGATSESLDVQGAETGNNPVAISTIRPVNVKGIPTKKGQKVFINGKMLGYDQRENKTGFQIVINDGTGGVVLRDTKGVVTKESFKEGDEVEVSGTVGFFNGTTQLSLITSITKKSTGNKRPAPKKVTKLDETTEQELIKLENVTISDKTQWKGTATNTRGFNVGITYGGNKKGTLRIENNPGNLHTKTYQEVFGDKTSGINLVGIGGQYDNDEPFTSGYQILVYKKEDISTDTKPIPTSIDDDLTEAGGKLYPNPINTGYLTIELPSDYTHTALVEIFSIKGEYQLSKAIQNEGTINVSSLNQGVYIAKIIMGERVLIQKVIVTK